MDRALELFKLLLPKPLPYLTPRPGTVPLTPQAAILPPLLYYLAAVLLAPFAETSRTQRMLISISRNVLAFTAAALFLRLPLAYHVPFSVGLTYQLALVGLYGGLRVIDALFISYYGFHYIPRRVIYQHQPRTLQPQVHSPDARAPTGPAAESYFSLHFLQPGRGEAVTEYVSTETQHGGGWPRELVDRASWALELILSMRGAGFSWTSADVRHTRRTWRPTFTDRAHSIVLHGVPVAALSWAFIRWVHTRFLATAGASSLPGSSTTDLRGLDYSARIAAALRARDAFEAMPLLIQLALTGALGAFLMAAFSIAHSSFAILLGHIFPHHPLSYFPPLYTLRVWQITSVRGFWSYGWHRLFSRLFLVYGVWPGQWIQRTLFSSGTLWGDPASAQTAAAAEDVGKVLGAFASSAVVHSFAGHMVVPGGWANAAGEAQFFMENGVAVVLEEAVKRVVRQQRKRISTARAGGSDNDEKDPDDSKNLARWYDGYIGRIWWIAVLLYSGRNFARGWVMANLVREMAFA